MKKIKLSLKLMGGFGAVALITLLVGLLGIFSSGKLAGLAHKVGAVDMPSVANLLQASEALQSLRVAQRTLLNPEADLPWRQRQYRNMEQAQKRLQASLDAFQALPMEDDEAQIWRRLLPALQAAQEANQAFAKHAQELEKTNIINPVALLERLESFRGDLYKLLSDTGSLLLNGEDNVVGGDPNLTPFGQWLGSYQTDNPILKKTLDYIKPVHAQFYKQVQDIKEAVSEGALPVAKASFQNELLPSAEKMFRAFKAITDEAGKAQAAYAKMNQFAKIAVDKTAPPLEMLGQLINSNQVSAQESVEQTRAAAAWAKWLGLCGVVGGVALAVVLGTLLSLGITRPLGRVIAGLGHGARQVSEAAGQMNIASQSLAEGSSRQAASLEETSSSLEEMASMTRQNADNAHQANSLAQETNQVVAKANQAMGELTSSMSAIKEASEQTGKIIKTIDEIAFQTNLLALNAAVEAARAGEAGAGFAVVADEVRNLAMRAAEAAKNTSGLIEETMRRINGGSQLVEQTNRAFGEVKEGSLKVAELVAEIAAASSEQAQGIDQVSKATAEMDQVTQQNAANAEQSAASSEELSGQALTMQGFVAELEGLMGGAIGQAGASGSQPGGPEFKALPESTSRDGDIF
ncbi:MAG: methyl-accepting chemotaxis protein [Pseudomonadota bacterium]